MKTTSITWWEKSPELQSHIEMRNVLIQYGLVVFLCIMMIPFSARASSSVCDKVLEGDLINKVLSSSSKSSSARAALREYIFSKNENEAYELYEQEYESAKKQGQSGGAGVSYFGIGGELDFSISYENKISRSEFAEKFSKAQQSYQKSRESSSESNTSLASSYASYVRDTASIDAWKACVTQQQTPGLYAFGSRDDSDVPYVNVVWAPGTFAGAFPSIPIEIVLPRGGATLDATTSEIAIGSGRMFRIDTDDIKKGFAVIINGILRNAQGGLVSSYSAKAVIPPIIQSIVEPQLRCVDKADYPLGRWRASISNARQVRIGKQDLSFVLTKQASGSWFPPAGYVGSVTLSAMPAASSSLSLSYKTRKIPTSELKPIGKPPTSELRPIGKPSTHEVKSIGKPRISEVEITRKMPIMPILILDMSSKQSPYKLEVSSDLVVSSDGCTMYGTVKDSRGEAEVNYQWEGVQLK